MIGWAILVAVVVFAALAGLYIIVQVGQQLQSVLP